jgi:hypothetical protein
MKGDYDIRMVFNGNLSGPNTALWAPWFCLPNATTHMRIVEPGTFMVDVDIEKNVPKLLSGSMDTTLFWGGIHKVLP